MGSNLTLTTERLGARLGLGDTMVKRLAVEYEAVVGRELERSDGGGWLFPGDVVVEIERARAQAGAAGSFRAALLAVVRSRRSDVSAAIVLGTDEGDDIRQAGVELEWRLRETIDRILVQLKTLQEARALEDRQRVQLVKSVEARVKWLLGGIYSLENAATRLNEAASDLARQNTRLDIYLWLVTCLCILIVVLVVLMTRFMRWSP
jgi:uncharacterized membrane protein YidH (DUF202 family)